MKFLPIFQFFLFFHFFPFSPFFPIFLVFSPIFLDLHNFSRYYLNMCIQMLENPLILSFLFQPLLFALSECLSHKPSYQPNLILRFINLSLEIEDNFNWIVKFLVAGFNSENCQMVGFV